MLTLYFIVLISIFSTTLFAIELSLVPMYRQYLVQECCLDLSSLEQSLIILEDGLVCCCVLC